MRRYRETEPSVFRVVGIGCDRCGHTPAAPANSPRDLRAWGELEVYLIGSGNDRFVADLCQKCAAAAAEWVNAGRETTPGFIATGRGMSGHAEQQADVSAAERFIPLDQAVAELALELSPIDREMLASFVRQRGGR
jgi:hypothetical protein